MKWMPPTSFLVALHRIAIAPIALPAFFANRNNHELPKLQLQWQIQQDHPLNDGFHMNRTL